MKSSRTRLPRLDYLLDLLGVAVFAISGALAGAHRGLDLFGIAVLAAVAVTLLGQSYLPNLQTALLVADAFGLGLFALSGAQIAEAGRHSWIVVILMGTMTGVAGGVVRDLLSGVVPLLLRRDIYATAAIAGICIYLLMQALGIKRSWAFVIGIVWVVATRLLAIAFAWQLPVFAPPIG